MSFVHEPTVFHLGPLAITGFGIAVALAFLLGHGAAQRELVRRGHDPTPMGDVLFAALIGFIIGAKTYYAALRGDWHELFNRAGLVYWGGMLGGILAVAIILRYRRVRFLHIADATAPGLAAAYAVGRTGCWAVGDDYGAPWNGPLAVAFPQGIPPSTAGIMASDFHVPIPLGMSPDTVLTVHPTQLYETALGMVMFWILFRLRDHGHAEGWLFGLYCVLAGVERFIVEFYRAKGDRFVGPFTTAQTVALGFLIAGIVLMWRFAKVAPGRPGIHARGVSVA
jgi:phosphatidylglycerol---prolipoprotein diacylglyceryl transferase